MESKGILTIFLILLIIISLTTQYSGHIDVQEYGSVSKFFSGFYKADIRSSHSMLYSFLQSPFLFLFKTFFIMKIISLLFLIAIIISSYYISNKNKRVLLLLISSPIIWYSSPWITPISISALFFLWGYFFLNKYSDNLKPLYLIYSGLLFGLSWSLWNTILYVLFFLVICFFYNRNINHLILFLFFVFLGIWPLLIFDQIVYGMFFYSILRHVTGVFIVTLYGSIYQGISRASRSFLPLVTFLLMLPLFSFTLFSKKFFKQNKRQVIFLVSTAIFFLFNPQIRYILLFWPILILLLSKSLNKKQVKIQILIFLILSLVVINPYIIQIKYSTNSPEFSSLIYNFGNWKLTENRDSFILQDLKQIIIEHPNEIFVVGNNADDYAILGFLYWGDYVKEFVSIQDYNLFLQNEDVLFEKTITSKPKINDRRQIFISGGIKKTEDNTDYSSINLGISINEPLSLDNFQLIKEYKVLSLYKKQ